MSERFGIVTAPTAFLYDRPGEQSGSCGSELTDDMMSGWAFRILEEKENSPWLRIVTFYGYEGWVFSGQIREISCEELEVRQDKQRVLRIGARNADLLALPKVQGMIRETLPRGAFVEKVIEKAGSAETEGKAAPGKDREQDEDPAGTGSDEKWTYVRSASGTEGWVFSAALEERRDGDAFLLQKTSFPEQAEQIRHRTDENTLREGAVQTALSYMGSQYRWGGKSTGGIDCSGLVFMSWMRQGILIYRDAKILPDYPVREIERKDLKRGDLIFFPGHVGMYLGGDRFIHATAFWRTPYVTVNSLNPADPDYREDLAGSVTMCGTVF